MKKSKRIIVRLLAITIIFVAGSLLPSACSVRSVRRAPTDAIETTRQTTGTEFDMTVSSKPTGEPVPTEHPKDTITPTPTPTNTPTPEAVFDLIDNDMTRFGSAGTLEFTKDGIYFIDSDSAQLFPDSRFPGLSTFLFADIDQMFSTDGSCVALIPFMDDRGLGKLYYSDGTSAVKVAEDVDSFILSDDGSALLYLTGFYDHGVGGSLNLFDRKTGESMLVSEGAGRLFALSPSGGALAFTTFGTPNDPDSLICHYRAAGGETETLGEGMYPIALTDDAGIIYTVRTRRDGALFSVYKRGEKTRLFEDTSDEYEAGCIVFNRDRTQVVFASREKTYLSVDGDPAIAVFEKGITSVGQKMTGETFSDEARNKASVSNSNTGNLCNITFLFDEKREKWNETQVAEILSFDEYLRASSAQVSLDEEEAVNVDRIDANDWSLNEGKIFRESEPDVIYYLEVDEDMPYHPDYDSSDRVPYGHFYRTLYRVENKEGAEPVKIAEKVCEVRVGDFGIIYKQYSGPAKVDGFGFLDIVKVYHSADGEHFNLVTNQHIWLSVALGG